jgi:hypothetical protein
LLPLLPHPLLLQLLPQLLLLLPPLLLLLLLYRPNLLQPNP